MSKKHPIHGLRRPVVDRDTEHGTEFTDGLFELIPEVIEAGRHFANIITFTNRIDEHILRNTIDAFDDRSSVAVDRHLLRALVAYGMHDVVSQRERKKHYALFYQSSIICGQEFAQARLLADRQSIELINQLGRILPSLDWSMFLAGTRAVASVARACIRQGLHVYFPTSAEDMEGIDLFVCTERLAFGAQIKYKHVNSPQCVFEYDGTIHGTSDVALEHLERTKIRSVATSEELKCEIIPAVVVFNAASSRQKKAVGGRLKHFTNEVHRMRRERNRLAAK